MREVAGLYGCFVDGAHHSYVGQRFRAASPLPAARCPLAGGPHICGAIVRSMHRGIAATLAAAVVLGCSMASADPRPLVLVNHIGYDVHGSKKVVVQSASDAGYDAFQVVDPDDRVVFEGKLAKATAVDRWSRGVFSVGTFSQFQKPGTYRVVATGRGGRVTSQPFMMAPKLLPEASISEVLFYLKGQRSSGLFDKTDRSVPFFGEKRKPVGRTAAGSMRPATRASI